MSELLVTFPRGSPFHFFFDVVVGGHQSFVFAFEKLYAPSIAVVVVVELLSSSDKVRLLFFLRFELAFRTSQQLAGRAVAGVPDDFDHRNVGVFGALVLPREIKARDSVLEVFLSCIFEPDLSVQIYLAVDWDVFPIGTY